MLTTLLNKRIDLTVSAEKAILQKHEQYFCPGCEVPQYPTRSQRGNAYSKCFPGNPHAPNCPCIGLAQDNRCINIDDTDIGYLDKCIMTAVAAPTGGCGGNPGPPRREDEKQLSPNSLKHIYQLGLCSVRDFALNATTRLRDILLNRFTIHTVMDNNLDIGPRAVVAKPDFVIFSTMTIRFAAFTSVRRGNDWVRVSKIFDLRFADKEKFDQYVKKLFYEVQMPNGTVRYESRYEWVLIYGRWKSVSAGECKAYCRKRCDGNWPCRGYQWAECSVPAHQIYCPAELRLKK